MWLPVFLASGIGIYFTLPDEPPAWLGVAGLSLGLLGLAFVRRQTNTASLVLALAVLSAMSLGLTAAQFRVWSLTGPVLSKKTAPVWVSGRLEEISGGNGDVRLLVADLRIPRLSEAATPRRVRIRARGSLEPEHRPSAERGRRHCPSPSG